ncbi:hypothetical protein PLICRDRAFT_39239 [Plicaturopsis crispa FD-325 SS-3]|nr:hypothetical protein PLICRDRAFT_39239 [Plicaturopsis crispa FD-325 SS-3]
MEHSRKRQRVECEGEPSASDHGSPRPPVRDTKYYMEDGDCTILVENILFKVHRFLLSRDSSAFHDMFGLPGEHDKDAEGSSDENPVTLPGDTADEFRALMFILYALPHETQSYNTSQADVEHLVVIARITNKYHFTSMAAWAFNALTDLVISHPSCILRKSHYIERVVEVALLANDKLLQMACKLWTRKLRSGELPAVPAIIFADKHNLPDLQGHAYYAEAISPRSVLLNLPESAIAAPSSTEQKLSQEQRARLLSGYFALVRLSDNLPYRSPDFPRSPDCPAVHHAAHCSATFRIIWGQLASDTSVRRIPAADVRSKAARVHELMQTHQVVATMTLGCKATALQAARGYPSVLVVAEMFRRDLTAVPP